MPVRALRSNTLFVLLLVPVLSIAVLVLDRSLEYPISSSDQPSLIAFRADNGMAINRIAHIARKRLVVAHLRNALGVLLKVEIDIDGHSKVGRIGRNESPAICGVLIKLLLNVFGRAIHDMLFVCEKLCVVDQRFKLVFLHLFPFAYKDERQASASPSS